MTADQEWLETDGCGGYAMHTAALIPTRRYHGFLIHSRKPPVDRVVLVNDVELTLERGGEQFERTEITSFEHDSVPTWHLRFADGTVVEQTFRICRKPRLAVFQWRQIGGAAASVLCVRPLLTGREFHALHYRNPNFQFDPVRHDRVISFLPYKGIPETAFVSTGEYVHDPQWRTGVYYREDDARGFECREDCASPGSFAIDLDGDALLAFAAGDQNALNDPKPLRTVRRAIKLSDDRRKRLGTSFDRAADAYFVARGSKGRSIIAGYPWFNDWGRDTLIALRGLGIARNRRKLTREVLHTWADALDRGMLPNCFADDGKPSYRAMDAPLWFVVAAHEFLSSPSGEFPDSVPGKKKILRAIRSILDHYCVGTRHGIRADDDGLLTGGTPDTSLTWMDARVDGVPVTPRNGKPVEINALWINAVWIGAKLDSVWAGYLDTALASFQQRFWLDEGYLADVINDESHTIDRSFRPNQIFAVGGLPLILLPPQEAEQVVNAVAESLYTPHGLRSLAPTDPRYHGRYEGGPRHRDSIYHQGTAWAWLLGPFVEAWMRVHDFSENALDSANERFMLPWLAHVGCQSLGHVSEIADGDPPHTPRGCPFQAWSLGELLRVRALMNNAPPAHARGLWIAKNAS